MVMRLFPLHDTSSSLYPRNADRSRSSPSAVRVDVQCRPCPRHRIPVNADCQLVFWDRNCPVRTDNCLIRRTLSRDRAKCLRCRTTPDIVQGSRTMSRALGQCPGLSDIGAICPEARDKVANCPGSWNCRVSCLNIGAEHSGLMLARPRARIRQVCPNGSRLWSPVACRLRFRCPATVTSNLDIHHGQFILTGANRAAGAARSKAHAVCFSNRPAILPPSIAGPCAFFRQSIR